MILFHHLITDKPKTLGLPTEQFLWHVRFLKKHYRIASLPEALEMLGRDDVPVPTVVLTFDDGYAENFLALRAVAEAENVPVTLFVCTQAVSDGSQFDHDLGRDELGFPALTWDQVRYFDRHGVTIGSHTRSHFDCGLRAIRHTAPRDRRLSRRPAPRAGPRRALLLVPQGAAENMSEAAVDIAAQHYPYVFSAIDGANRGPLVPGGFYRCTISPPSGSWN